MKLPNRLRAAGMCHCGPGAGAWHRIGLTRDGRLVALDHSPEEARRWWALAELGGRLPECLVLVELDPCDVTKWPITRHRRTSHKVEQVLKQVGRVLRLRAERLSARDLPGQGKRNRRLGPPEPPRRPRRQPPVSPEEHPEQVVDPWLLYHLRAGGRNLVESRYRRLARRRKLLGDRHRNWMRTVFYEGQARPPDRRKIGWS